jgi:hypothetical protein
MDAVVKAIHGSPEFTLEAGCRAVDEALRRRGGQGKLD